MLFFIQYIISDVPLLILIPSLLIIFLISIYIWGNIYTSSLSISLHTPITLSDIIKAYIRILTKVPKRMSVQQLLSAFPKIQISAPLIGSELHLESYRSKLSRIEDNTFLPPFYLNALTGSLALLLGSHPKFPVRLLGAVNTSTEVKIEVPVLTEWLMNGELRAIATIGDVREVRRGIEFEFITSVLRDECVIWTTIFRGLQFMKTTQSAICSQKEDVKVERLPIDTFSLNLPTTAGRTYAKLGFDFNPIHLHNIGAKLFGFPKMLAHGMWVVAQADAKERPLVRRDAKQHVKIFLKKPTFLPANLKVKVYSNENDTNFIIERTDKQTIVVIEGYVIEL